MKRLENWLLKNLKRLEKWTRKRLNMRSYETKPANNRKSTKGRKKQVVKGKLIKHSKKG